MPLILEADCDECGHRDGWSDVWIAFLNENGEEEVVPHPGEARYLEERGLTFGQLRREGRLLRRHPALCEECGHPDVLDAEDPRVASSEGAGFRVGCTALFLVPAAMGVWLLFATWWLPLRVLAAILLVAFSYRIVTTTRPVLVSSSLLGPASRIDGMECTRCGGDLRRPIDLVGEVIACPACSAPAYRVAVIGRS